MFDLCLQVLLVFDKVFLLFCAKTFTHIPTTITHIWESSKSNHFNAFNHEIHYLDEIRTEQMIWVSCHSHGRLIRDINLRFGRDINLSSFTNSCFPVFLGQVVVKTIHDAAMHFRTVLTISFLRRSFSTFRVSPSGRASVRLRQLNPFR